ncbi:uncharacterized protein cubi_03579 [Cryptosporidium ubiquitum]|uniref:Uncharacterized protein n=1 Tax=Cryptosporidium ubiquitum TaxID=857276 RepID=A0A1J4MLN1_9CRYT|nr:uncharacterized protein cubi_03579 [Cryptosporidium ubiquitum]OII73781.1 hypothetical protein cubi_03579 [Cryptosporidium ubiquitum]
MLGYSGLSIGISDVKKVQISQANPVQLSNILLNLRYKAFSELSNTIYTYQSDYQYQYKYYLAKLSRYEDLEHTVTLKLCSMLPEVRQRINSGSTLILQNYSDEEIYYSQYPIPHNIFVDEIPIFREFTFFLSLRRSLLDLRKKIWRLYSIIETKSSAIKLWESEYQEAILEKAENEYIYGLTTNDYGRNIKDYAEKLKQKRSTEFRKAKEMIVLNNLENRNNEELEKIYSDNENDHTKQRDSCLILPIKRRVSLHCSVKSESPSREAHRRESPNKNLNAGRNSKKVGNIDNEVDSIIPDSNRIKKKLNKLPPKPEKTEL